MSLYHQMRYSETRIRPTVNIFQYRTKRQVNSGRDSNLNSGIGTKNIGKGVFETRSAGGARVYFKNVENILMGTYPNVASTFNGLPANYTLKSIPGAYYKK